MARQTEQTPREILAELNRAWNSQGLGILSDYLADDVEVVNSVGFWWRGREAVVKGWTAINAGGTGLAVKEESERQLSPDVVVITQLVSVHPPKQPDGSQPPEGSGLLTWLFVRRNGRWLIAANNTTAVNPAMAHRNPVKP